jgi:hypothetical protein
MPSGNRATADLNQGAELEEHNWGLEHPSKPSGPAMANSMIAIVT